MPNTSLQAGTDRGLSRRVQRLDGLPIRAATARAVLEGEPTFVESSRTPRWCFRGVMELDPGWVLRRERAIEARDPLDCVASLPWWPAMSRGAADCLGRIWRHSVAVALAAHRLARLTEDCDAGALATAGFLHGTGLWALAAVDPDWVERWATITDPSRARALEESTLGMSLPTLSASVAERWGLGSLVVDACWFGGDPSRLVRCGGSRGRALALLREAMQLAAQTPWAPRVDEREWAPTSDPRVKLLIAEVQARCLGPFVEPQESPREEHLTRENARLRLDLAALRVEKAASDQLLSALATSDPSECPESWAERSGMALCGMPGVSAARVDWTGQDESPGSGPAATNPPPRGRPPTHVIPLRAGSRTLAVLQLWAEDSGSTSGPPPAIRELLPAWTVWARQVETRARLAERLERVSAELRDRESDEDARLRARVLESLAEFAAGAGHELNNPLAVVVGRAQLLLARETDPWAIRSLRAILNQGQRAHRILRDLMYVARPPEPRPRFCQPEEILKTGVRDARLDAEEREVSLGLGRLEGPRRAWVDPEGLRHVVDSFVRNALEATPPGGRVSVGSEAAPETLRWTIHDSGRGLSPEEARHLLDPFYCGRQAGRGLGLGLPRAARFVNRIGGRIGWQSTPGIGTSFSIEIPLVPPPEPPTADRTAENRGHEAGLHESAA